MNRDSDESIHGDYDPVRDNLLSATQADWDWLDMELALHATEHAKGWRRLLAEVREGLNHEVPHKPLPVPGYVPQNDHAIHLVSIHKRAEESLLRMLDGYKDDPKVDQQWLAIGRTGLEQGFMAINRAIFKPERAKLPQDS